MNFKSLCSHGEKADQLYTQGRYSDAMKAYLSLLEQMESLKNVDSYLISKITLGVLLTHIKLGQLQAALSIWNSNIEESLYGIGIYGLENAQTTVEDMLAYDFICAYLHSVSEAPAKETAIAITQYMSRVCEHALEFDHAEGDGRHPEGYGHQLRSMAIGNWKLHLREVFPTSIPFEFAKPLIESEKKSGEQIVPKSIQFPRPTAWTKPVDFREMSHVVSFEPLEVKVATPTPGKRPRAG